MKTYDPAESTLGTRHGEQRTKAAKEHSREEPTVEAERPNIVFFFWDNLGWGEFGCYGGGVLRGAPTPISTGSPARVRGC